MLSLCGHCRSLCQFAGEFFRVIAFFYQCTLCHPSLRQRFEALEAPERAALVKPDDARAADDLAASRIDLCVQCMTETRSLRAQLTMSRSRFTASRTFLSVRSSEMARSRCMTSRTSTASRSDLRSTSSRSRRRAASTAATIASSSACCRPTTDSPFLRVHGIWKHRCIILCVLFAKTARGFVPHGRDIIRRSGFLNGPILMLPRSPCLLTIVRISLPTAKLN